MFDFFSMADNYEDRKVDNFLEGELVVDTCAVTDSSKPFETGVCHPQYNSGAWIIVELYDTSEEAQQGHDKWVSIMTAKELPEQLMDVSSADIAMLCDINPDWRTNKKV